MFAVGANGMRVVWRGVVVLALLAGEQFAHAQETRIAKTDTQIDGLDPGIKLFLREKMAQGNTTFTDSNVVLFLHGATAPSTCPFETIPGLIGWPGAPTSSTGPTIATMAPRAVSPRWMSRQEKISR